jgi:hypothetical protein
MTDEQIKAMLSDIVCEIDYDIWKEMYNKESAEDPEEVDMYYNRLLPIVKYHMRSK